MSLRSESRCMAIVFLWRLHGNLQAARGGRPRTPSVGLRPPRMRNIFTINEMMVKRCTVKCTSLWLILSVSGRCELARSSPILAAQVLSLYGAGEGSCWRRCGFSRGTCAAKRVSTRSIGAGPHPFSTPAPQIPHTCATRTARDLRRVRPVNWMMAENHYL